MLGILGVTSAIADEFTGLLPTVWPFEDYDHIVLCKLTTPMRRCDKLLVCTGVLFGKSLDEITPEEEAETFRVNFTAVVRFCNAVLHENPAARICIIGSESAYSGSYDGAYAGAKAALHSWIETRGLEADQQLVGIAPGIIADAGMTTRRHDQATVDARAKAHPMKRLCTAKEVASLAAWLLGPYGAYVNRTVIRMDGGRRA